MYIRTISFEYFLKHLAISGEVFLCLIFIQRHFTVTERPYNFNSDTQNLDIKKTSA
ncbi:hypothetical protein PEPS_07170 [Persicobacter psychrovividus]|uniref:Uncharacterized protein n=1 Tax=Persicobacter psychrovividus TaxID=387638 RepID=A0ABM7VBY3_9BACT|nr:hypothetical protein PEPS_07170 [Persicobacter psychrovividus]